MRTFRTNRRHKSDFRPRPRAFRTNWSQTDAHDPGGQAVSWARRDRRTPTDPVGQRHGDLDRQPRTGHRPAVGEDVLDDDVRRHGVQLDPCGVGDREPLDRREPPTRPSRLRSAPCWVPLHSARIIPVAVVKVTRSGILRDPLATAASSDAEILEEHHGLRQPE